jgi:hypothetical protein
MISRARRLWWLLGPYHALTYFAPEARETFESVGLPGFWRGYFAGRAAPLGPVGPGPVVACFYGFHPDFVARALPSVWAMATPDQALEARLTGAEAASRRLFPEPEWESQFAEASDLLRDAFEDARWRAGRCSRRTWISTGRANRIVRCGTAPRCCASTGATVM